MGAASMGRLGRFGCMRIYPVPFPRETAKHDKICLTGPIIEQIHVPYYLNFSNYFAYYRKMRTYI